MNVVLVTGGTRGIGFAIVQAFLNKGFKVVFTGSSQQAVNKATKQLNSALAIGVVCDFTVSGHIEAMFKSHAEVLADLQIVVNNAGVFAMDTFEGGQFDLLSKLLEINVLSAYKISLLALPLLKNKLRAHIFNMCSIAGLQAYPNGFSYGISKFALNGMSKSMRMELMQYGIRVTTVFPGATLTDSWAGVELPSSRFSQPNDIAASIVAAYDVNEHSNIEELVIRPLLGDI